MPTSSVPSDRKLVHALHVSDDPGMRKLIVGMLTKDAWTDADETGELDDGAAPDTLSHASIKAVLRWNFEIDLRD